jgi:hypothetical protein
MNPSCLLQGELQYELRIHEISIDGHGQVLWKNFCSVMSELVLGKFENLGDFDPHEHVNYTAAKYQELKALLDQPVSNFGSFVGSC